MTPTYVVVPVRNHWHDLTRPFLQMLSLQAGWHDVLVIDNGSEDGTHRALRRLQRDDDRISISRMPGRTISEMWSAGFRRAKRRARGLPFNVAILNNDVKLAAFTFLQLDEVLRAEDDRWISYPDYSAEWDPDARMTGVEFTRGVFGSNGMFGPAFMLRGEAIYWEPLITDPAYQHWFQDDHLAECVELAGGLQVRAFGLPVWHQNEGTASDYDLYGVKLRDRGAWVTRHQRGYGVAP